MDQTIVFFDIDGTLVDRARQIPPSAVEAIARMRRNGHLAVINTGRPFSHIEPAVTALDFDGYVCSCGAHIVLNGEVFCHRAHPSSVCREMIELVRRTGLSPIYESEQGMFFDSTLPDSRSVTIERAHYRARGFDVDRDIDVPGFSFDKFVVYELPGCDLDAFRRGIEPYYDFIGRSNAMLELVYKGCSKAQGIRLFCERTGIPPERCIALGDGFNDVSMFRAVGHSAVMGDGDPRVFCEAEYVTAPLAADGLQKALDHFGLL